MQGTNINVLMADDHRMVREALAPFVRRIARNVAIHEASNLDEACRVALEQQVIDLIVLDLYMPGMEGLDGLKRIRQVCPTAPIVILSGSSDPDDMQRVLDAGATGYVPKTMIGSALTGALTLALSGERFFPPELYARANDAGARTATAPPPPVDAAEAHHGLTPRQWAVLELVVSGLSNKEIARRLGIEEITVKVHVQGIFRKMRVANRTQATAQALASGWFVPRIPEIMAAARS
jgi:two-component system, NarL family, nitrate/nitrite response regulator NarL